MLRRKQTARAPRDGSAESPQVMLHAVRERIRSCRESALECDSKAKAANSERQRAEFLRIEKEWLNLVRSYEFAALLLDMKVDAIVDDRDVNDTVGLH